nr:MAG TPA: hypothetical protein [Caudoviricetes sp.]
MAHPIPATGQPRGNHTTRRPLRRRLLTLISSARGRHHLSHQARLRHNLLSSHSAPRRAIKHPQVPLQPPSQHRDTVFLRGADPRRHGNLPRPKRQEIFRTNFQVQHGKIHRRPRSTSRPADRSITTTTPAEGKEIGQCFPLSLQCVKSFP